MRKTLYDLNPVQPFKVFKEIIQNPFYADEFHLIIEFVYKFSVNEKTKHFNTFKSFTEQLFELGFFLSLKVIIV